MLTAEVLPVIAADDAVVSENAVNGEDAAEEEEFIDPDALTPEEQAIINNLEPGESYEVKDGEDTIVYERQPVIVTTRIGDQIVSYSDIDRDEAVLGDKYDDFIYAKDYQTVTLSADPIEINGSIFPVNVTVGYNSRISYRAKAVKEDKVCPTISGSGLYDIANVLSPAGTEVSPDVIKWKFTFKNNKLANKGAYFTVKASVDTKIAKQYGITGKTLKTLKKAVSRFNKMTGKKANRIPFTIDPYFLMHYECIFGVRKAIIYPEGEKVLKRYPFEIRCRLDESQPVTYNSEVIYKEWTKPSKSDVKIKVLLHSVKRDKTGAELHFYYYSLMFLGKNYIFYDIPGNTWYASVCNEPRDGTDYEVFWEDELKRAGFR